MEKSSKNYISLFGGKPARGLPTPPPPFRAEKSHIFHMESRQVRSADAISTLGIYSWGKGGGGGEKCETVPFVNRSSNQLQTQNQDSKYHSAPSLFRQDVSISYWWPLASFGKFI